MLPSGSCSTDTAEQILILNLGHQAEKITGVIRSASALERAIGPSTNTDFFWNTSTTQLTIENGIASKKIILKKSTNSKERRGFALYFRAD